MASWLNQTRKSFTSKEIKALFNYDSGNLVWKKAINNRTKIGGIAGCLDKSHGYREVRINYKRYYVHRLVWAYFNGAIPEGMSIDHINHNPSDNRIENLRLVTHRENHRNQRVRKNNTSGYTGVTYSGNRNKWIARITVNGRTIRLGRFATPKLAYEARLKANIDYGFHKNHGLGVTNG